MGEAAKKIEPINTKEATNRNILETIKKRQLSELVFGFCGAVGSGVSTIAEKLEKKLTEYGYDVVQIKISDILCKRLDKYKQDIGFSGSVADLQKDKKQRVKILQDLGDHLREKKGCGYLSQLVIKEIVTQRDKIYTRHNKVLLEKNEAGKKEINIDPDIRIAWFIDSFKNPDEVEVFRNIYRNIFYLIGVLCPKGLRAQRLEHKGISRRDAAEIIERDQSEENDSGQQLIKTIHLSDCFINNSHNNIVNPEKELSRFLKIIFGSNISPTKAEFAMYIAYSSAMRSSCLSRQVGSTIVNSHGDIIATGCNDVPKAGGGLYGYEDLGDDCRCLNMWDGGCSNDRGKNEINEQIEKILLENNVSNSVDLARKILKAPRLKGLTEFTRAVHAEMDALISAARNPNAGVLGADMYVTTFPCHNCARHIVAAGIKNIYYIEPYEKSLAVKLHNDSISTEERLDGKVTFLPFQGVAPRQYQNLFVIHGDRKSDGKATAINSKIAKPINEMFIDRYFDYESKVVEYLEGESIGKGGQNEEN